MLESTDDLAILSKTFACALLVTYDESQGDNIGYKETPP